MTSNKHPSEFDMGSMNAHAARAALTQADLPQKNHAPFSRTNAPWLQNPSDKMSQTVGNLSLCKVSGVRAYVLF